MRGKFRTSFWRENGLFIGLASLGGVAIICMGALFVKEFKARNAAPEPVAEVEEVNDEETPTAADIEIVEYKTCELSSDSVELDLNLYLTDSEENKIEGEEFGVKLVSPDDAKVLKTYVESINTLTDQISRNKDGDKAKLAQLYEDKAIAVEGYTIALEGIKGEEYTDTDKDGMIYIPKLEAGKYVVCFVPAHDFDPKSYTVDCEVKAKVEYKAAKNIAKKVKVYVAKEDTNKKAAEVEKKLVDTITLPEKKSTGGDATSKEAAKVVASAASLGGSKNSVDIVVKKAASTPSTPNGGEGGNTTPTTPTTPENPPAGGNGDNTTPTTPTTPENPPAGGEGGSQSGNEGGDQSTPAPGEGAGTTTTLARIRRDVASIFTPMTVYAAEVKDTVGKLSITDGATLYNNDSAREATLDLVAEGLGDSTEITVAVEKDKQSVLKAEKTDATHVKVTVIADPGADTTATVTVSAKTAVETKSVTSKITIVSSKTVLKDAEGHELYKDAKCAEKASVGDYKKDAKFYYSTGTTNVTRFGGPWIENGKAYYYDSNGKPITGEQVINGTKMTFSSDGALVVGNKGIDVSKFQGKIDWAKVSTQVSYAIIRCGGRYQGSGELYEDPNFYTNMKGAKANSVAVGIYFYSTALTEAEAVEEASLAISMANQAGGCTLPIYIDMEDTKRGQSSLTNDQRTAIINAFCNTVANAGYRPGLYASKTWMEKKINAGSIPSNVNIWVARYNTTLGYSGRYNMWQYTSSGKVDGISGNVDMNISY